MAEIAVERQEKHCYSYFMFKSFDVWNQKKKALDADNTNRVYFHEREIWWCSLGVNIGFEQDGKGKDYERPVVILKKFNARCCLVVPLTTAIKTGKYYFQLGEIDKKSTTAILSQLRFIDRKRLINKVGRVSKKEYDEIRKAAIRANLQ